ncbi:MAG: M3 family oligoendopeptidase [Chloroflexi bacterium]|nr:M3 family oligoendopeptidase [Chloroflexota bacterium]MBI3340224.1 M3 family oligoendopeptidase [Chloroflexota bacterium]
MSIPLHWDMTNVYPSLESKKFKDAIADYKKQVAGFEKFFDKKLSKAGSKTPVGELAALIGDAINRINKIQTLSGTIVPFIYSFVTTDSRNKDAMRALSEFEQASLPMDKLFTRFRSWLGKVGPKLDKVLEKDKTAGAHAFMLREAAEQSKYQMGDELEGLASELSLSGGNAFGKLQGTVTSQLSVDFELDGETKKLPMPALINLRSHPDESVRRRGYEAENKAWDEVKETLAACLNGVKGEAVTLNKRRGRKDAVHSSLDAACIDRKTLEAMLGAMEASFPMFRRYFAAKAKKLGKEKLAWWDIFAPLGKTDKVYSFEDARDFILDNFGKFSPDLSKFAKRAFDNNWIDAEQRDGKRGGAFCMGVAGVKESRVLCNFDGSFDQVSTIAHELGHAFHNECAYSAGKTELQQLTPMTLAETASTMCETIVTEAVLANTKDPQEELAVLEAQIQGAGQIVVDIYSRYLFEKEVFERREQSELSADDFNDIMERAQKATYGEGIDEKYLQKFMWTWKPHYYSSGLSFYNFPYAFGLLFATGLYAIYKQRGADFVDDYKKLLASTGEASAADLAKRFGIDIRKRKFWEDSLAIIGKRIDRFCEI